MLPTLKGEVISKKYERAWHFVPTCMPLHGRVFEDDTYIYVMNSSVTGAIIELERINKETHEIGLYLGTPMGISSDYVPTYLYGDKIFLFYSSMWFGIYYIMVDKNTFEYINYGKIDTSPILSNYPNDYALSPLSSYLNEDGKLIILAKVQNPCCLLHAAYNANCKDLVSVIIANPFTDPKIENYYNLGKFGAFAQHYDFVPYFDWYWDNTPILTRMRYPFWIHFLGGMPVPYGESKVMLPTLFLSSRCSGVSTDVVQLIGFDFKTPDKLYYRGDKISVPLNISELDSEYANPIYYNTEVVIPTDKVRLYGTNKDYFARIVEGKEDDYSTQDFKMYGQAIYAGLDDVFVVGTNNQLFAYNRYKDTVARLPVGYFGSPYVPIVYRSGDEIYVFTTEGNHYTKVAIFNVSDFAPTYRPSRYVFELH